MRCLSHPTGRIINRRPENALDLERVFEVALEEGVALEVNGLPARLDLRGEHVRDALRAGVQIVCSTDAHSVRGLANMELSVRTARRGWATAARRAQHPTAAVDPRRTTCGLAIARPDGPPGIFPISIPAVPEVTAGSPLGERAQLVFVLVLGLHDTEAPRSRGIEHRTEDHHLARLDERPPVRGVAAHDLALVVGHVDGERRARSDEPEHERAHARKSMGGRQAGRLLRGE